MSKHDKTALEAPAADQIVNLALADLILSPMNPRQTVDALGIAALAASIKAVGLMQNLAGFPTEDGKTGIVAGGRRLRALQALAETGEAPAFVPVKMARDEAEARMWAATENHQREALHPADEIRAFFAMASEGRATVADIASAFGETEAHVKRRLRLGCLPAPVLDALKAGKINLGMAQAFAASDDETLILSVLDRVTAGGYWNESEVRRLVLPDTVSASDRRVTFIGLDAYEAAGGKVTRDLFADNISLHDLGLLDRLFAERLDEARDQFEAEGWKWVTTSAENSLDWNAVQSYGRVYRVEGELTEAQAERYDELAELWNNDVLDEEGQAEFEALEAIIEGGYTDEQRAVAGVIVYVGYRGALEYTAGLVHPDDVPAAVEAGLLSQTALIRAEAVKAEEEKPILSAALANDIQAMHLAAVQGAMLDKPELALDLLAFQLAGEGFHSPRIFEARFDKTSIAPTTSDGFTPDARLAALPKDAADNAEGEGGDDIDATVKAFTAFRAKGKKHRNAVLVHALARSLIYGCSHSGRRAPIFDLIQTEVKADLRDVWTPNAENFFGRVKADYLHDLLADLTGCDRSGSGFKDFTSHKKGEKADMLENLFSNADHQKAWKVDAEKKGRIEAWKPEGF